MINVKISYICLGVSHHWCHHHISSSTGYGTHLANLRSDIHDRLAAKQLQFPWAQALPAALHWQLMTFINSGGAGGPLTITGDGMVKHLPTSYDNYCWGNLLICCLPEHRLMVCSEHVKGQLFVRRRQRLHEWWFAFLLSSCIWRHSSWCTFDWPYNAAKNVWHVFSKSSRVAVSSPTTEYSSGKFPSRSLLSALSFPLLKEYDTVSQPVTACIPRRWRLLSPRAATMSLMFNTVPSHFSICTRAFILSFRTQNMRMTKTSVSSLRMRMTFFPSRTASTWWTSARYELAWWGSPPTAVKLASSVPRDRQSGHRTCGCRLRRDSHSLRLSTPSWKHAWHVASICHSKCLRFHCMQRRVAPPDMHLSLGYRYNRWKTSRCAFPQDAQWLLSIFLDQTTSPALRPCTIAYPARCELKTCHDSASTSCNTPFLSLQRQGAAGLHLSKDRTQTELVA